MGEAKIRGNFEERKSTALVKERKTREVQVHIAQRRQSPKLAATMGLLAAMMQAPNVELTGAPPNGGASSDRRERG